jgi:hypothetical protein
MSRTAQAIAASAASVRQIPADLLYWARLPAGTGGLAPIRQDFRFEQVLPVPVDSLHVARTRLRDGGWLLVGIEPDRLRAHLADHPEAGAAWSLVPDRLPAHLAGGEAEAALARLDLRHGPFEPDGRRRLRRRRDLCVAACLGLTLLVTLIGIERRVAAQGSAVLELHRRDQAALDRIVGKGGNLPAQARLAQELRRLEQAAQGGLAGSDLSCALQHLWAVWPADVRVQVESVSLTPGRLVVRGSAPSLAEADRIARACPSLPAGAGILVAEPLHAELSPRGAAFLLSWTSATGKQRVGP